MVPDNWNFNGSNPCLYHGGNYNQNQNHGPFYVNYNRTSNSNDNIGCRILAKPQATNIFAYPTTYVVDRSGNIVGEPIVGAITEKKQAETLQKLIEQALAADVG